MTRWLPAAAAAATALFVGSTMVATRWVIVQSDPASLALLRYAVGFLCLLPPLALLRRVPMARGDIAPIALLGIAQFGVLIALLNYGLQYIGAALGALIFAGLLLLTMGIAAGLRAEALTWAKSAGVALTIVGVALALGAELALPSATTQTWLGAGAVFAATLTGALCSVLYRPYLQRYPALQIGAFAMAASVLFLCLPAGFEGFFATWPEFTAAGWGAVLFIGTSSGIGYYLWLWALQHTTPTKVTIFMALSPITAAGLGALLLDEVLTAPFMAGLACVASGLVLAHIQFRSGRG